MAVSRISLLGVLWLTLSQCVCAENLPDVKELAQYQFDRTKALVDYVHRAAQVFSKEGLDACNLFSRPGSSWLNRSENKYLFIYDRNGTVICHPVYKILEGKNIIHFKDLNGKSLIRYLIDKADQKGEGWVHYLWAEPDSIFPLWKSSFVMKVIGPSGKSYVIGSGIYNMRLEKQFIVDTVNDAADWLVVQGTKGLKRLQDPSSPFIYEQVYVFVIDKQGNLLVDPAFPDSSRLSRPARNIFNVQDATGKYIIQELLDKMKTSDTAWSLYLWPKPGDTKPSKQAIYVRKVEVGQQEFIIGSALYLANPIWFEK